MSINLSEPTFRINKFNLNDTYDGINALAKQLLNLLITEPGTYPSCPEMGIGINLYKLELLNKDTISELRRKITQQTNKYIPNNEVIRQVIVEPMPKTNNTHNNGVYIGFQLKSVNDKTKDYDMIVVANSNEMNDPSKTITEFYIV